MLINSRKNCRVLAIVTFFIMAAAGNVFSEEVKDGNPPAFIPGPSILAATGGPDAFGYIYSDINEPHCAAGFIDISATGTQVANGDEASSGAVALAEPFNIYGTAFNSLNFATNGYITTDLADTGPDLSNDCPLPAVPSTPAGTTGARLYPLHDDLLATIYVQHFASCPRPSDRLPGESCTIVMWDNVTHWGGGGPFAFEAILYHTSGDISYQYGTGNPETGSGSTTGLQNFSPPTTGLTYACNSGGSIPANFGVCIYSCADADWDGTCDTSDLCPGFDDKIDTDSDGVPDGCDPDDDGDGVASATEDAVNPSGDGNNDGILDSLQSNVSSLPSATGQGYITVETVGCSLNNVVAVAENPNDPSYSYPYGLVGFVLPGCPSDTVKVYFHGASQLSAHDYRKYGPLAPVFGAPEWYTMPGVTFGTETVEGPSGGQVTVATATFALTNGGIGDDTDANDGDIVDQGGPGLPPAVPVAVPTLTEWGMIFFMLFAGAGSVFYLRRQVRAER